MSILDLLTKLGVKGAPALAAALQYVIDNSPDLAPGAQAALDELNAAVTPEALAVLGATVISELKDVAQGKFEGKFHPSDLGG